MCSTLCVVHSFANMRSLSLSAQPHSLYSFFPNANNPTRAYGYLCGTSAFQRGARTHRERERLGFLFRREHKPTSDTRRREFSRYFLRFKRHLSLVPHRIPSLCDPKLGIRQSSPVEQSVFPFDSSPQRRTVDDCGKTLISSANNTTQHHLISTHTTIPQIHAPHTTSNAIEQCARRFSPQRSSS